MKFTKTLAGVAAASVAVSSLATMASADKIKVPVPCLVCTVEESSGPKNNVWELNFETSGALEWGTKVDKIVATVTSEAYCNGAMGGNTVANDGWAASAQCENKEAGTNEWVWEEVGGLKTMGVDDKTGEEVVVGYFKVEFWWMNAITNEDETTSPATAAIETVEFFDAEGESLYKAAGEKEVEALKFSGAGEAAYTYEVTGDDTISVTFDIEGCQNPNAAFNAWCGELVTVKSADGTMKYYDFGGESVSWGVDIDGDEESDTFGNVDGSTSWLGSCDENGDIELTVPAVKGDTISIMVNSWSEAVDEYQFILTEVKENAGEVPAEPEQPEEPEEPAPEEPEVGDSDEVNPDTGVALTVVPTAIAAIAVAGAIVLKKRSK